MTRALRVAASLAILSVACVLNAAETQSSQHSFGVQDGRFVLDGKPYQIISGAMHYERIPRAYWRVRLRAARAMGLNTIETYAFWNAHEPRPGEYDFSGNNDVAEFIREAQQEGLHVILRPGPYACAEWEFGGYPAWLLKDRNMVVRANNPAFLEAASRWLHRLGEEVAPLQIGNGGPIIAVQVENEYGSYGSDHAYMQQIRRILVDSGFNKAMLYTADGADKLAEGTLPDLPAVINFGPGDAQRSFGLLKKFRPNGPFMCGEYWDGWFDHWGGKHETPDPARQIEDLRWMLAQGYSVNLYMFDGGTSFGWMNGANSGGKDYQPDVTSYDYDVPVAESGELRPKYFAFRKVIQEATGAQLSDPPPAVPRAALPEIKLERAASLWDNLPAPISSDDPLSMEEVGQSYGYILYRTTLHGPIDGKLKIDALHSYARIYLDGKPSGSLDRRLGQSEIALHAAAAPTQLDILVENSGRVNYGPALRGERAGITNQVLLDGKPLRGWQIFPLPMENLATLKFSSSACTGPCFYEAQFTVKNAADTFLDTRSFGKGQVWINGRALGRFWHIGPQQTLYLPGPWLDSAKANTIVVFDLDGEGSKTVTGLDHHILDELNLNR